jgi:hypothetical protein
MKFRKFGKTVLTAALSSAIVFSLSSCVRSFTVGYLYVTGTVTATPSGPGIISGFKINNDNGKLTAIARSSRRQRWGQSGSRRPA